jgi:hypothetical protein
MNDETTQRLRVIIKTALRRCRIRAMRDAPVYLEHIDRAEIEMLQALAAEIERAEAAGMQKVKNIIAYKMKRDIKMLEPYLKDLQSKTEGKK